MSVPNVPVRSFRLAVFILPAGFAITVPSSATFLYFNSQPGDYIGGGIEQLYTAADTSFNGSLQPGGYGLTARE